MLHTTLALKTVIFTILMALPRFGADTESPAGRAERMGELSQGIESAALHATCTGEWADTDFCTPIWPADERIDLVMLLVSQGFAESRFSERVHADQCAPYECDAVKLPDGRVYHRAKSPWQLQRTALVPEWRATGGRGEYRAYLAAYGASKVLAASRGRCRSAGVDWEVGTISGYAGAGCYWRGAPRRALLFRQLRSKAYLLLNEQAEPPRAVAAD